jgi:hypothetical protein
MAHFKVTFNDKYYGLHVTHFETFPEAQEYWDDYANTETCVAGVMVDVENGEIIWAFDEVQ